MAYGSEPAIVDHIDGPSIIACPTCAATREENARNARGYSKLGFKGVSFLWQKGMFAARIYVDGS